MKHAPVTEFNAVGNRPGFQIYAFQINGLSTAVCFLFVGDKSVILGHRSIP
jgi:hypothetical protein